MRQTEAGLGPRVTAREAEALPRPGPRLERACAEAGRGEDFCGRVPSVRGCPGGRACAPAPGGAVADGFVDGQIRPASPSRPANGRGSSLPSLDAFIPD